MSASVKVVGRPVADAQVPAVHDQVEARRSRRGSRRSWCARRSRRTRRARKASSLTTGRTAARCAAHTSSGAPAGRSPRSAPCVSRKSRWVSTTWSTTSAAVQPSQGLVADQSVRRVDGGGEASAASRIRSQVHASTVAFRMSVALERIRHMHRTPTDRPDRAGAPARRVRLHPADPPLRARARRLADVVRRYWMPVWSLPPRAGVGAAGAAVPRLPDRDRRRLRRCSSGRSTGLSTQRARRHRLGARHHAPAGGRVRARRRSVDRLTDTGCRCRGRRHRRGGARAPASARRSATTPTTPTASRPRSPPSRRRSPRCCPVDDEGLLVNAIVEYVEGDPRSSGSARSARSSRSPSAASSGSPPAGSGCRRSG